MMELNDIYKKFLKCSGVTTDSREVKKDTLFFALKGENFNGNQYAGDAIAKGAKYAVIDDKKHATGDQYILVEDVLKTLQELANHHRRQMPATVFAITGSNGKTTTKELINQVLQKKYKTVSNIKNYNNHIGVPLTLLSMNMLHNYAIVEMGANHPGEIDFLCQIAEPEYGLITNIGKAHLEGFGSLDGVIKTKSELYHYVCGKNGMIFYNKDNLLLADIINKIQCDKITYSMNSPSDYKGELIGLNPFVQVEYEKEQINSQLIGKYNFENILAAITAGRHFDVPLSLIKEAIEEYVPENNRSQVVETQSNKIILDAYNANPTSMEMALENFSSLKDSKKVVILGDMFELGRYSDEEHKNIIKSLENHPFNKVYLIGPRFSASNADNFDSFMKTEDFIHFLKYNPLKGNLILIKGSRGMALEKIVSYL